VSFHTNRLRENLRHILKTAGLLSGVRRVRRLGMVLNTGELSGEEANYERFLRFERQYEKVLRQSLNGTDHEQKRVLVFGSGFPEVEAELGLIKALELEGYVPVVLIDRAQWLELKYYQLAVKQIHFWDEFIDPPNITAAEAIIERCRSVQELLTFEYADARVGLFAVSTALRHLRLGSLDLSSPQDRQALVEQLTLAMSCALAAQRIVGQIRPELALFVDGVYTPEGELVDICLANSIDAISWDVAHKSNALMLKRYTLKNKEQHPWSLSSESWQLLRDMEWTEAHRERLQQEFYNTYTSGDWYSTHGTQFNKRFPDADEIRQELDLNPTEKTAFIFPHILWDASLSWGEDLFRDYEEWLIETVRAACANDQVNWVIKIHPAHVGKGVVEGFHGEPAEVTVLRQHVGELPPHIFFIPADSVMSTFSLFEVMDYCLTVRGTVGIEAARLGIPVLTAGTGRYDRLGFTIDSESREQYLERIAHIQEIPPLSPAQQELAERFAYGIFVLRPLPLETVTLEYRDDKNYLSNIQINVKTKEEWSNAPDLRAFAQWAANSSQPDFLLPLSAGRRIE
jgi:hypothetical protein